MHFTAPTPPFSKERPRVSRRGTYMSRTYTERRAELQAHFPPCAPLTGPVALRCVFRCRKLGRCDADNLAGAVMDAGNGILWVDDRQITQLTVSIERNCGRDEIEVEITPLAA